MAVNDIVVTPNLGPEFQIGTGPDPAAITVNVDGTTVVRDATTGQLSSPITTLSYDNTTQVLTYINEAGATTTLDMSALAADIFVNGASYDATTSVLTLTDNDTGTPDVTVDLSQLLGVSTDPNNLLGDGTDGKPFLDSATVCADITANCLADCVLTDAFGNTLGTVQMLQ